MENYKSKLFVGTTGPLDYSQHVYYIPTNDNLKKGVKIFLDGKKCVILDTSEITGEREVSGKMVPRCNLVSKIGHVVIRVRFL